ncbi:multidrug resistance efflux pump [Rhizobium aethiopicum]|uniref:Multidrug resistance efflux pump n=1 Tax=Rhizobium aethiopicum TaxID=1138170 RepID=A0A7W6MJK6_9HYPH|nr:MULTISPECIES: HlyD family efflux transporter periplasmic adaptor subunit [Rhizobium]MBB4193930.1 multidrug resistance efflux pump [Rhizobium aethiopicum]MBB4581199.1 multidrug resistance efflux pump [Rhizobium aethiopicum]MDO3431609.1 HlyD family efflux transporter periplasmic adaptor subunit [Rhizobium sp. CBN3]
MIWNHRITRIVVGLLLLALVTVVSLPTITGFTSLDGTVNARFAVVNAPIDGTIAEEPLKVGSPVKAGQPLAEIRNTRVNRAILASLEADRNTALDRVAALKKEREELSALREELSARLEIYRQTTIANLEREVEILRKKVEVSQAQDLVAQVDLNRRMELESKGILTQKLVEVARAAGAATGGEVEISNLTVDQLEQRLNAVRQGIFVFGDGQNDVPYSRQREDEVVVRINDLNSRIAENETRATEVQKQLIKEADRVSSLESATAIAPFDGVVWTRSIVDGSNVVLNDELMRLLDCRELFVDILVPEVNYDEIYPGLVAQVRLFGRSDVFKGTVISARGSSASVETDSFAASLPPSTERNARIRVRLDPSFMNGDFANSCQVGRTVQVRFSKHGINVSNWVKSLWFSIF